jgi:ankyrin repeat protein
MTFARPFIAAVISAFFLVACGEPAKPTLNFYRAVQVGDLDQIKRHLFWGSEVNQPGPDGSYPLHVAVQQGRVAIARELLKHGARTDLEDGFGRTPLHASLANGKIPAAQLLLDNGAHDDLQAVFFDLVSEDALDRDGVDLLAQRGVDLNALSPSGQAAMHMAVANGNVKLAKRLLVAGADVNREDSLGRTPLAVAGSGDEVMINLLAQYGAHR